MYVRGGTRDCEKNTVCVGKSKSLDSDAAETRSKAKRRSMKRRKNIMEKRKEEKTP